MDWIISPVALRFTFWLNVFSALANLTAYTLTHRLMSLGAFLISGSGAVAVGWVRHEKARRDAKPAAFLSSLK